MEKKLSIRVGSVFGAITLLAEKKLITEDLKCELQKVVNQYQEKEKNRRRLEYVEQANSLKITQLEVSELFGKKTIYGIRIQACTKCSDHAHVATIVLSNSNLNNRWELSIKSFNKWDD